MRDEKIIDLYWERNEQAIKHTDEKYGKYLTKIAYNILADKEDSKESVNDTYLAAWNSMPPQRPTALSAYLGKITRQISIDIFRKRNRAKRKGSEFAVSYDELGDVLTTGNMTEEQVQAKLLGEAINKFLLEQPKEAIAFRVIVHSLQLRKIYELINDDLFRVKSSLLGQITNAYFIVVDRPSVN